MKKHSKLIWKYLDIIYCRMIRINLLWYFVVIFFSLLAVGISVDDQYTRGASFVDDYGPVNMD